MLDFVNNLPKVCPYHVQQKVAKGETIELTNHCCVYEDFKVTNCETSKSIEELFGKQENTIGQIYNLLSFLQSWKYVKLAPKIAEIRLNQQVISSARTYLENIVPNQKLVAVHMRVLDASGQNEIFNFPGPEYFHKAFNYFHEKWTTNLKFLIFCDKPSWCRKQSLFKSDDVYIMDTVWKETSIQKKPHQATNMHRYL